MRFFYYKLMCIKCVYNNNTVDSFIIVNIIIIKINYVSIQSRIIL